jgi:hypothetical protein
MNSYTTTFRTEATPCPSLSFDLVGPGRWTVSILAKNKYCVKTSNRVDNCEVTLDLAAIPATPSSPRVMFAAQRDGLKRLR